jgi:hypothetical protein
MSELQFNPMLNEDFRTTRCMSGLYPVGCTVLDTTFAAKLVIQSVSWKTSNPLLSVLKDTRRTPVGSITTSSWLNSVFTHDVSTNYNGSQRIEQIKITGSPIDNYTILAE